MKHERIEGLVFSFDRFVAVIVVAGEQKADSGIESLKTERGMKRKSRSIRLSSMQVCCRIHCISGWARRANSRVGLEFLRVKSTVRGKAWSGGECGLGTKKRNKKENEIGFEEDNDKARRKHLRVWNLKSRSLDLTYMNRKRAIENRCPLKGKRKRSNKELHSEVKTFPISEQQWQGIYIHYLQKRHQKSNK